MFLCMCMCNCNEYFLYNNNCVQYMDVYMSMSIYICPTYISTIRPKALALSYSAAEYACPVWAGSPHASKLDPELNDTCRSITGCLRPTDIKELYLLSGIAPPGGKFRHNLHNSLYPL